MTLRAPAPGDMGWIVQQHGALYAQAYGWDARFEAAVAQIAARFLLRFDPERERGWIALRDGQRVGSVALVRKSATVAQLRLLLLAPQARGLGLGGRLTDEAIAFARTRGYRKMVLWTHPNLTAARALYAIRGFSLARSEPHPGYGQPLPAELWTLRL